MDGYAAALMVMRRVFHICVAICLYEAGFSFMRSFSYICGASLIYAVARCALALILLTQLQRPEGSHQTWTLPFGFWVAAGCGASGAGGGYAAAWMVMRRVFHICVAICLYEAGFSFMRSFFYICGASLIYAVARMH